jgi:hypothetical protein
MVIKRAWLLLVVGFELANSLIYLRNLERATEVEPATSSLGRERRRGRTRRTSDDNPCPTRVFAVAPSLATCGYLPYSRQNSLNLATHHPQGCPGDFHSSIHCRDKHQAPSNRLQTSARLDGTTRHVDVAREHYNYLNELFRLTESSDADPIRLNQVPALHAGFAERSRNYNPFPLGWRDRLRESAQGGPLAVSLLNSTSSTRRDRAALALSTIVPRLRTRFLVAVMIESDYSTTTTSAANMISEHRPSWVTTTG